ncbi:hypothetical protein Q8A67_025498 [Cirrhinus molitorella]|uniref:Uncharacterized protein n=1 Tax=Cirrhinus molitorella TaxID=172907 RepID=A0AA88NZQ6_9TELE|nr:hypothetical protein Q8A67_025498 [Cirrhinus molitorella]
MSKRKTFLHDLLCEFSTNVGSFHAILWEERKRLQLVGLCQMGVETDADVTVFGDWASKTERNVDSEFTASVLMRLLFGMDSFTAYFQTEEKKEKGRERERKNRQEPVLSRGRALIQKQGAQGNNKRREMGSRASPQSLFPTAVHPCIATEKTETPIITPRDSNGQTIPVISNVSALF